MRLIVTVTPAQKRAVTNMAQLAEMSVGDYVRAAIKDRIESDAAGLGWARRCLKTWGKGKR